MSIRKQFSLRDLVWFVSLCAVSLGWYLDHRKLAEDTVDLPRVRREIGVMRSKFRLTLLQLVSTEAELKRTRERLVLAGGDLLAPTKN